MTREDHLMLCKCGHARGAHFGRDHGEDCAHEVSFGAFCRCKAFREAKNPTEGESEMAKNKKAKRSGVPRGSNLVYFADADKLRSFDGGRLLDKAEKTYSAAIAQVLAAAGKDGLAFEELATKVGKIAEHKSEAILRKNIRWYFSSKRSEVARFVKSERAKAEAAKPKRSSKPRARKPQAAKLPKADDLPNTTRHPLDGAVATA